MHTKQFWQCVCGCNWRCRHLLWFFHLDLHQHLFTLCSRSPCLSFSFRLYVIHSAFSFFFSIRCALFRLNIYKWISNRAKNYFSSVGCMLERGPVDKKLISMFDAKLKWIEWGANNCHCSDDPDDDSNDNDDDDDDERVRPREGKKHIPHQSPFPSPIFFHCRNILILFLSASFAAGYERKLNNFQSNGYCNTTACIARWLKDADGI